MDFTYTGERELDTLGLAVNYYRWIYRELKSHLHGVVLEVGAGSGTLSNFLLKADNIEELLLLEPAKNLLPLLKKNTSHYKNARVLHGFLHELGEDFRNYIDVIVCCNVLEHVENDRGLVKLMYPYLKPGGKVLIYLPANPKSHGPLDESVGHFRRYTKKSFNNTIEGTGFKLINYKYINMLGGVVYFLSQRLLRSRDMNPFFVKCFDKLIVPVSAFLEKLYSPPFGHNLFAVLQKDS
jgi:SAM-dependent methyltransferase